MYNSLQTYIKTLNVICYDSADRSSIHLLVNRYCPQSPLGYSTSTSHRAAARCSSCQFKLFNFWKIISRAITFQLPCGTFLAQLRGRQSQQGTLRFEFKMASAQQLPIPQAPPQISAADPFQSKGANYSSGDGPSPPKNSTQTSRS